MSRLDPSQDAQQPVQSRAGHPKSHKRAQQQVAPRESQRPQLDTPPLRPLQEPLQEPLTIVAPIDRARKAQLDALLAEMSHDPGGNRVLPFARLPRCHFGRVLVWDLPRDLHGRALDPLLILISDCDGPAEQYLEDLVDLAGSGVEALFGACIGFPSLPTTQHERLDFLRRHRVVTPANYIHRPGRTVAQIQGEAKLRSALQGFLDASNFEGHSALDVRTAIIDHVGRTPALHWALDAPPGFSVQHRAREWLRAAAVPAGLSLLSPLLVPAALGVLAAIRLREEQDPSPHIRPSPELVRSLARLEDHFAHNGFTAAGELKPGVVRQVTLAAVLQLIGYGTRHLFTRDSLAGVTTIHFARWIPIDGGRRVIFASNYDGSLEAYNDDFIDIVWWGLNLVFGNGYGYPKTRWLVFGGSQREQEFKDYLRRHQVPTPVWYSAYPDLTTAHIKNNAAIRRGLHGRMSEREARAWLRLL